MVDWFCGRECPSIDFPLNINGFAVNIELIMKSENPSFPNESDFEVSEFVKNLIKSKDELEPKADMCSKVKFYFIIFDLIILIISIILKIYVWNTITAMPNLPYTGLEKKFNINYEEYMIEQV